MLLLPSTREQFGVAEVMEVVFYDLTTREPVLYLDTLKMSNMESTAEQKVARGGIGNPVLITWDYNQDVNFALQDALLSPSSFAALLGNPVERLLSESGGAPEGQRKEYVRMRQSTEYEQTTEGMESKGWGFPLVLKADEYGTFFIETAYPPTTRTPGQDILSNIWIYPRDGEMVSEVITVDNVDEKIITFDDAYAGLYAGMEVIAYYDYEVSDGHDTQVYTLSASNFPGFYEMVGTTFVRNMDGIDERFQVVVPRCKMQPGFNISMQPDGDPSVFDMNITVFRDKPTPTMVKFIKY